jgi:hypothetical protein
MPPWGIFTPPRGFLAKSAENDDFDRKIPGKRVFWPVQPSLGGANAFTNATIASRELTIASNPATIARLGPAIASNIPVIARNGATIARRRMPLCLAKPPPPRRSFISE